MGTEDQTFELSSGGKIKITAAVLRTIEPFKQVREEMPEAGGILMGRFIKEATDIIIDQVTSPMKGDVRSRYTFKRLSPLHQAFLNKQWRITNGTCNYLGEWHTHPEEDAEPSRIDIKDWKRKLKNDNFSNRFLYFIIAGTDCINVWEGDRKNLEIIKLKKYI